jgi:protease-4
MRLAEGPGHGREADECEPRRGQDDARDAAGVGTVALGQDRAVAGASRGVIDARLSYAALLRPGASMSASNPGLLRRFFRGTWRVVDVGRRVVLNLLFVLIVIAVLIALAKSGTAPIADKTALVLGLDGSVTEQRAGNLRATAFEQLRGGEVPHKIELREVLAALDTAAHDDKITSVVLILDDMDATGLTTLREIGAALDRFKAAGKKVVAWGSSYDQRQYYLAAHANEVYLHPLGGVSITGFGGVQNYYKDALDRLGVSVKVMRAGSFKDFGEAYTGNEPSPESREAEGALLGSLWKTYTDDIEKLRKLAPGAVMQSIDAAPEQLAAAGGDEAKLAVANKLVDGLKTRDELRAMMIERGAEDSDNKTFRQISFDEYLGRVKPRLAGDAVGVIVAEGEIVDGTAPIGTVGGLSTANLVRRARENKDVKAIVLRVNSPGGSVFGSELVRRELELTRAAGKPVVVSMGDVAASGGYWISTASDEIIADATTVTGSIGVIALLPNGAGTMDKLSIHSTPIATTWLRSAGDPRVPLDPRLAEMIQKGVDHEYGIFIARVAQARKTTPEKIDAVAQGRVWSGSQALERGLVDRLGLFGDAIKSAAARARLGDDPRVIYIEREPSALSRFVSAINADVAGFVSAAIDKRLGGLGVPASTLAPAERDLGWLAGLADRRKPFDAVAHCLCRAPL